MNEQVKLIEAKLEVSFCMNRILNLVVEICDRVDFSEFSDIRIELNWRFDELERVYSSGDPSLMFSAVKLASRHIAAVEESLYGLS